MKFYYVEWADAIEHLDGWQELDEAKEWAMADNWIVKQTGWLLDETEDYILLAGRINPGSAGRETQYSGLFKIPRPWIRVKKEIKL